MAEREAQLQAERRRTAADRYMPFVEIMQSDDYLVVYIMFNIANENPPTGWNFPASVLRIWAAYGVEPQLERLHPAFATARDAMLEVRSDILCEFADRR